MGTGLHRIILNNPQPRRPLLELAWFGKRYQVLKKIDWYFDFISPFAYLASESLWRFPADIEIRPRPILFAGLLNHWQTRGPGEIPPMRKFIFRHVSWLADSNDIALTMPPAHPFNPLRLLRLCVAMDAELEAVQRLFRFVWAEGCSSDDEEQWQRLVRELGAEDVVSRADSDDVKATLRQNTETALEAGVFGVPGFVLDGEVFWGFDSIDFLLACLADPGLLQSSAMRAADEMPEGLQRQQK
jgi:2-hydroxychromene-2-carboxylate isomerase